ncbi:MAG TPA: hypothetical protein PKY98_01495 [Sedimentibacter sp.]|mgnify:CR=1 FL=1|nr:hypothetical protein [Sedimentibacter sp.]HNZ82090.1 hypothetical protein [Sedimentibacter sp.]HOH69014.1 hypothetical protein [Sedimentibacter sp.]HPW99399.1 hypothetical protein [Sedimentibacter sp.]
MKFFCNSGFIRKAIIVTLLSIIILLLLMGRFRTMRIRILGLAEGGYICRTAETYLQSHGDAPMLLWG